MADQPLRDAELVRLLKDRAESYWRDAIVLREDGDLSMSTAYKTIAEELRRCAEEVGHVAETAPHQAA
jgi:hypothetical protein